MATKWSVWENYRYDGYSKGLSRGDHVKPKAYDGYGGSSGYRGFTPPGGRPWTTLSVDIPSSRDIYDFTNQWGHSSALNKAWSDLISKVHSEQSQLGASLAETGEAFEMIINRVSLLHRAYGALRKGKFRAFLRILRVRALRKHRNWVRNSTRETSRLWLEYHFGWSPMCQDIYDAAHIFTKPIPSGKIFGKGHVTYSFATPVGWSDRTVTRGPLCARQGGTFLIENPNVFLLARSGLANPIAIAWELVPFSFVVDWFSNVGDVINGWSDLLGLKVTDSWNTVFLRTYGTQSRDYFPGHYQVQYHVWAVKRRLGLSSPVLEIKTLNPFQSSWKRAATGVSLFLKDLIV